MWKNAISYLIILDFLRSLQVGDFIPRFLTVTVRSSLGDPFIPEKFKSENVIMSHHRWLIDSGWGLLLLLSWKRTITYRHCRWPTNSWLYLKFAIKNVLQKPCLLDQRSQKEPKVCLTQSLNTKEGWRYFLEYPEVYFQRIMHKESLQEWRTSTQTLCIHWVFHSRCPFSGLLKLEEGNKRLPPTTCHSSSR